MGPVAARGYLQVGSAAHVENMRSCQSLIIILKVDVGNKLQLGLIHETFRLHGSDFLLD
jgi:hypothetical protein